MKDLKNQLVLITGAGSGIGRLMALNFAREGSRLVIWDINGAGARKVADEVRRMGGEAWDFMCDVADKAMVNRLADKVKREIGKVDILVNNAGIVSGKPFMECTDEQVRRTMEVNVLGIFWTTRAFLPDMVKANHGHLVEVASAAGQVGTVGLADYCASKFALVGFDEAIRMELRKKKITGVKTTCVCPFFINTGMFDGVKTRFNFLLPIIDQNYAADKIVKYVKRNRAMLMMPWLVNLVPLLRLLPVAVYDCTAAFLGVSSAMDGFKGRVEARPVHPLTSAGEKKVTKKKMVSKIKRK